MATANAVMTVERYLDLSGDDVDEQSADRKQISKLIAAVSDMLESYLRRVIRTPTSDVTEYIYGHGSAVYYAAQGRINSVTSLKYQDTIDGDTGTITWTLMTTADYPFLTTETTGKFEFVNGDVFTPGQRYQFIYASGWAEADVPEPIQLVAAMLIKRLMKTLDDKEGVTSKSVGDQTTSYDLAKLMTSRHREILRPYKVV